MTIAPQPDRVAIARDTARALIEIEAIRVSVERPFMFSSGLASPVYIDCRRLISFPEIRERVMDHATDVLCAEVDIDTIDALAGGETAGIPFAAWIAANTRLPMQYVRKRPKGYGPNAQVEGVISPGQRVVLIEDLTTDAGSKFRFCNALRRAGAVVSDCLVVFYYDIFPQTRDMLAEHGLRLHSLANWQDILSVADTSGPFDASQLAEIRDFLDNPLDWSARHGGAARLTF